MTTTMDRERRKEPRYLLATEAILERKTGERVLAFTVNISGSGLLVTDPSSSLDLGEEVRCGIKLYQDKPPQSWGVGRVVRVDGRQVAIDFSPRGEKTDGLFYR